MDLQLKGKTALVLGGSKGLGRGVAEALAAEGVAVALGARGREALDKTAAEINARSGGRAIGVTADTGDWASLERAVKTTRDQLGPIEILLNNHGGPPPSPVLGVKPEIWEAQFHAMVLNIFRITELVLPDMQARKWGRIINVASESVVQPIAAIGISNTLRGAILPTLAVWIEAIFLTARPRRSELGLAQVPIGTASAQHAAQIVAELFDCRPREVPIAVVELEDDEPGL